MPNPKNNARGGRQEELENQPNILAEEQDMEDELEENVGAVPRKVTMEEYAGAEKAFNDLVASEEEEFETLPFRPGKNAKYVLTDYQKGVLQAGIDQIGNYLREEDKAKEFTGADNKRLRDLHEAMKKIVKDGLDSLSPEERKTVDEFSAIMDGAYHHDSAPGVDTIIKHMRETAGINVSLTKLHSGLDMLGVVTGNPATYQGNKTQDYLDSRTAYRKKKVLDIKYSNQPEEFKELVETAKDAGIDALKDKFKGTEIGEKLGQISDIVRDLNDYHNGRYRIEEHLKAADSLGAFLTVKGKDGKSNYDKIAEAILGKERDNEQKKAFDMLLGRLNTVCDLDVNVPAAIEAQEEYEWNQEQQKNAYAPRIDKLNDKIFGEERTVHARDKDFLESVDTLAEMIGKMNRENLESGTENITKMRYAALGCEEFAEAVRRNSSQNKLEKDSECLIHMLDLGKTLQRKEGNKTLYELLADQYEKAGKGKAYLDETLKQMNERLDMKVAVPGQEIEGSAGPVEQHAPYVKKIKEVQRSSNRMEDPVQLKMALASVLALRRMSVDPAHKDHKKVRTKAAYAKAVALMETKAFQEMTKGMSADELAKKIYFPGNFDKKFAEKLEELDLAEYKKRLSDKTYQNKLASAARNSAGKLKETGTGVYLLGVKRGSNSGMYDRAVLAMQQAAKNPDAATTMRSVQTVKEYLSNKMTRRKSPSGRERWQDCMEFLHEAMPEKEFQEYCDQINSVRKAKEGSADHISPDQFIPNPQRNSVPVEQKKADEREEAAEGPGLGRNSV